MKRLPALLLLLAPAAAFPHPGHVHAGSEPPGWTLDLSVTGPLALVAILYVIGFSRLWQRSDRGRAGLRRDALLFGAGWLTLAGALVTPLHEAGERSFALHMIEHEIIMLISALLLVAARPGPALLWAFPAPARKALGGMGRWGIWRRLTDPVTATALQAIAIWAWHMPGLFDLALRHEGWHVVQHLSFLGTALLFWWAMLQARRGRSGYATAALCLFVTSMIGGALGALMALSGSPWYSAYAALGMTPYGLTPAQDQQLAGLIMWIPGGLYHLAAALWFMTRALIEREADHVPAQ